MKFLIVIVLAAAVGVALVAPGEDDLGLELDPHAVATNASVMATAHRATRARG
jgi:hypothetical protein